MNDKISYRKLLRIVVIGVLLYCGIQNYMLILKFLGHAFHMIFPFVLGGAIAFIINVPFIFLFSSKYSIIFYIMVSILFYIVVYGLIIVSNKRRKTYFNDLQWL